MNMYGVPRKNREGANEDERRYLAVGLLDRPLV